MEIAICNNYLEIVFAQADENTHKQLKEQRREEKATERFATL